MLRVNRMIVFVCVCALVALANDSATFPRCRLNICVTFTANYQRNAVATCAARAATDACLPACLIGASSLYVHTVIYISNVLVLVFLYC